jgi:hypothetical protein
MLSHLAPSSRHLSLPGALGMFGLAMGVSRISSTLPGPVYALLSGLNAATVGIITLAGVQLSRKAINGPLTRLLVVGTGCAGICYNALWYFPVILMVDGMITLSWSAWSRSAVGKKFIERHRCRMNRRAVAAHGSEGPAEAPDPEAGVALEHVEMKNDTLSRRSVRQDTPSSHSPEHPLSMTANPNESCARHGSADVRASTQFPSLQVMSTTASIILVVAFFGG